MKSSESRRNPRWRWSIACRLLKTWTSSMRELFPKALWCYQQIRLLTRTKVEEFRNLWVSKKFICSLLQTLEKWWCHSLESLFNHRPARFRSRGLRPTSRRLRKKPIFWWEVKLQKLPESALVVALLVFTQTLWKNMQKILASRVPYLLYQKLTLPFRVPLRNAGGEIIGSINLMTSNLTRGYTLPRKKVGLTKEMIP